MTVKYFFSLLGGCIFWLRTDSRSDSCILARHRGWRFVSVTWLDNLYYSVVFQFFKVSVVAVGPLVLSQVPSQIYLNPSWMVLLKAKIVFQSVVVLTLTLYKKDRAFYVVNSIYEKLNIISSTRLTGQESKSCIYNIILH